jgi:hypothetical protein
MLEDNIEVLTSKIKDFNGVSENDHKKTSQDLEKLRSYRNEVEAERD